MDRETKFFLRFVLGVLVFLIFMWVLMSGILLAGSYLINGRMCDELWDKGFVTRLTKTSYNNYDCEIKLESGKWIEDWKYGVHNDDFNIATGKDKPLLGERGQW